MNNKFRASFSDDKYRFLSNFWNFEKPLSYQGMLFKTSEAFYMAMKSTDINIRKMIALANSGAEAKKIGRSIELRPDWEDIKFDVMLYALRYKFSVNNPILRSKLLQTGDSYKRLTCGMIRFGVYV